MVSVFSRKRNKLGVRYGFIAGLFFTLAAWGFDAMILTRYHVSLPFLKFLPALLICVPLATLVGFLTAKFENGLFSLVIWTALAIFLTYAVINMQIRFSPWLISKIRPEYVPVLKFEEVTNIGPYWFYGFFAIGLACILCGILENLLIDQSLASPSTLGSLLSSIVCMVIMTIAGFSGDLLMTKQFREPLVTIDTVLQNGAIYYNQEVDKLEAREMRLSIVRPLGDLVLKPHSLTLVSTDSYLGLMKVLVDFGDEWALCHVVYSQPTFCEIIEPKFRVDEYYVLGSKEVSRVDINNNDIIGIRIFPSPIAA